MKHALANDWLKDLCLALKNVALYSEDHARGREYHERAYESLRRLLDDRRELALTRSQKRLFLDQVILDRDQGLAAELAEDLAARGVESLVFHATITPEEHLGFLRSLLAKPDRIIEKGGFSQILQDEGVSSVKTDSGRVASLRDASDAEQPGEAELVELLLRLEREGRGGGGGTSPSVTSVLALQPASVARAIETAARGREKVVASADTNAAIAEVMADTLERFAERAIEEHQRERSEVLGFIGRVALAADPATHTPLFLEKAGPRSTRKNLASAVETLPPELVAELVAIHHPRAGGDYRQLTDLLNRTLAWRLDRAASLAALERKTREQGMTPEDHRALADMLLWSELSTPRRLELLSGGDSLWRIDFARLKELLLKLFAAEQAKESSALVHRYLDGLMSEDREVRRRVADNARYLLQIVEKAAKAQTLQSHIAELFFRRLQDEGDEEVVSRLTGGLAFLADVTLRSGELGVALDLMRKAEQLATSSNQELKHRGEKMTEALSRAGNEKIFRSLAQMLLEGSDQSSMEASEILKRGGSRSAQFLIDRLAEEENRAHRARLVMLLKEMGKGSSLSFLPCLEDPRWFLVRNVVGILGDIGDANILPHLKNVASHGDPRVRRELVRTMTRFATPEAEEMIAAALADDDRGVQITAINSLATLKTPTALKALADLAGRSGAYEDAPVEVRQEALLSLGKLGAKEAFPAISSILSRKGFLGHSEPVELRVTATKALGSLGTPEARALLEEIAKNDSRQTVREAAQEGLRRRASATGGAKASP